MARLMQTMKKLTSNPDDTLLNLTASTVKRRNNDNRKRKAMKATISSPCCFSHVTQLDRAEANSIMQFSQSTALTASSQVA